MMRNVVILLLISWWSVVVNASNCTTYKFEEDFDDLFSTEGVCGANSYPWHIGSYEDFTPSKPFHELSTHFMYALTEISCARSFDFDVSAGGTVEVNLYIQNPTRDDFVQVIAYNEMQQWVGSAQRNGADFAGGWYTMRFTIVSGSEPFVGHLVFIGVSTPTSTVLVDSFRYIPPGMSESECVLYEYGETTIENTTEYNTESTTESNTKTTTESPPECTPECPPQKTIEIEMKVSITINIL